MTTLIELNSILAAAEKIKGGVVRTAATLSPGLTEKLQRPVYLKLENTQVGGSFKARGVLNKFASLKSQLPSQRFVAVSGGNFGIAVSQAARASGADVTIIMPQTAPASSIASIRALGIPVVVTANVHEAFAQADALAQQGYIVLDDCSDTAIAEGHGTLALEFIHDCPDLTDVFVAVGGGAMLAGVATALKAIKPAIRIWGVETVGANSMDQALRAGQPVSIDVNSIISTLGVPTISELMLRHAQAYVEEMVVVSDEEAVKGMIAFAEDAKQWVELASGSLVPAVIKTLPRLPADAVIGLIVCGGNISRQDMQKWSSLYAQ
ncbi:pyridoxal-phosphate dependent enzyme [Pseudomonas gingeri]|uniref:threonine ammonia-lyase n=1 Tax=Pseudomonas gingeri TaxID=117681 RepID=UPI0015A1C620|nr:pyridoxal-phosphate dependent enzyme [Pseudomonas gingeri]NVZ64259.1 pyridoxal-phosphate dependent enzyme [Pseudomonas gingeri]NVZ73469.1 pyridoxal-phosphate dependent enzyme [Pseudomonas gingeri]